MRGCENSRLLAGSFWGFDVDMATRCAGEVVELYGVWLKILCEIVHG